MNSPSSLVQQWPPTELVVDDLEAAAIQPCSWHHFASSCAPSTQWGTPRGGTTVWVSDDGPARAAIAWRWIELAQGVLVLENPNAVVANFHVGGRLKGLESLGGKRRRVLLLNAIVNSLNWQARVVAALQSSPMATTEDVSHSD